MFRTLMQVYVTGSVEAVELYKKAFDAELGSAYKHENGSYYHSELNVYGQILAVSERMGMGQAVDVPAVTGNVMQFCLHFTPKEKDCVTKAYEVLKEGAEILFPLGPCDYSSYMTDLIDRFGVRWCLFTD